MWHMPCYNTCKSNILTNTRFNQYPTSRQSTQLKHKYLPDQVLFLWTIFSCAYTRQMLVIHPHLEVPCTTLAYLLFGSSISQLRDFPNKRYTRDEESHYQADPDPMLQDASFRIIKLFLSNCSEESGYFKSNVIPTT